MAEETICIRARATMAAAALRLAKKPPVNFREDLRTELAEIARDTEKKLEALRQKSIRHQQIDDNASELRGNHQPGDMLLRANADILVEYYLLREDEINSARPKEHDDASTATEQASILSISDSTSDPVLLDSSPESEDINSWLQDSDDEKENGALPQQGIRDPSPSEPISPSLVLGTSSRVPKALSIQEQSPSRKDPSKQESCQRSSNGRKSVLESEEAEKAQNVMQSSHDPDYDIILNHCRELFPRSHRPYRESQFRIEMGKGLDTDPNLHRRRSHPIPASQPAGTSKNPIDLEKEKGLKKYSLVEQGFMNLINRLEERGPEKNSSLTPQRFLELQHSLELGFKNLMERLDENCLELEKDRSSRRHWDYEKEREIDHSSRLQNSHQLAMVKILIGLSEDKGLEKNLSSDPQNLPAHRVSAPQPATVRKSRVRLQKDKGTQMLGGLQKDKISQTTGVPGKNNGAQTYQSPNIRRSPIIPCVPLVRPAVSQPATSSGHPGTAPRNSLVCLLSALQPAVGSERSHYPSPQTSEHGRSGGVSTIFPWEEAPYQPAPSSNVSRHPPSQTLEQGNIPEVSQQFSSRRQPPPNPITPMPPYNPQL
ncbi:hypothetical protein F5B21DRAFT_505925 [Xylaria acuta]|nr:hypothetical protein F5B21DRAFT_505925 [Xylaria acuta]